MQSQTNHPKWWLLYLIFPLLVVLFVFEHRLQISTREHEALQLGIILLVYGLIYWWIKFNARAISRLDQQHYGVYRVVQFPPEANEKRSRILQIPGSEVRGVLSDTFEMDQVSQEVNKE